VNRHRRARANLAVDGGRLELDFAVRRDGHVLEHDLALGEVASELA